MKILDYLQSWPLYVLPHHALSRLVYRLTRIQSSLVAPAIRAFVRVFGVDLSQALITEPDGYATFNAFFTRELKQGLRPFSTNPQVLISPVDGTVSQVGAIERDTLLQAKGHTYTLFELLGGDQERAAWFYNGAFSTIYLSPRDYHRIHMPVRGTLLEQVYIPGRLFSVAPHTVRTIPNLFARNERVVALFETEYGKMALILVGAINVAAIETVWDGLVTPPSGQTIQVKRYPNHSVVLEKGAEMGRFNMGSTVIMLFQSGRVRWDQDMFVNQSLQLGRSVASLDADTKHCAVEIARLEG